MGRQAGTAGSFVMPAAREYAVNVAPVSAAGPVIAAANAWIDAVAATLGEHARRHIAGWLASGLNRDKLRNALQANLSLVFERLLNAKKGIYQQRVVIDDYGNIPGVTHQGYVNNSLPEEEILASAFGVDDPRFNLPAKKASTFTGFAELREVKPGEKLYRVTSDPTNDSRAKTGGFWTRTPPAHLSEVIGGTAVMPEWNNFQRVYEFTAPPYTDQVNKEPKFYVWEGPTAAQPVSFDYPEKAHHNYSLTGGEPQAFIPNHLAWDKDFLNHVVDITSAHKNW